MVRSGSTVRVRQRALPKPRDENDKLVVEPQHKFLDLGRARFSDVSFRRDYAEAALLEDAAGRDVVGRDVGVERPRPINGQERSCTRSGSSCVRRSPACGAIVV
jgi:hypothetical protein